MKNERTLTELRNALGGRIYIYLADAETSRRFLENAEAEGYRFGAVRPSDSSGADMIALEEGRQLSHVGFVGHMAFQCPSGVKDEFYRVDYQKFINGCADYMYREEPTGMQSYGVIHTQNREMRKYDLIT